MRDNTRGVKRKHAEVDDEDLGSRLLKKMHHDVKELRKAAKKAKTFETQKLLKKLKDMRGKGGDAEEIAEAETQLELLKHADHELIANTALTTKLNKTQVLHENPHIQHAIREELSSNFITPATSGTSLAKVQSRLLSSKVIATEVAAVITNLKNILSPPDTKGSVQHELGSSDDEDSTASTSRANRLSMGPSDDAMSGKMKGRLHITPFAGDQEMNGDTSEDEEDALNDDGWESGTVDSGGSDTKNDSGSDSGAINPRDAGGDFSRGQSDDGDSDGVLVPKTASVLASDGSKKGQSKQSSMESRFLPSLSVGFVRGDSDSEWSDSESKIADAARKNRRGQRARRAIWEKKYGKNANHVKKRREEETLKKGRFKATSHGGQNRRPVGGQFRSNSSEKFGSATMSQEQNGHDSGWKQRPPSNMKAGRIIAPASQQISATKPWAPPRGRSDTQPLHPSWEAKRKLKQRESAAIVASQGTKIVFTD